MDKLDKAVALYFPAEQIANAAGARCGVCMMFVPGLGERGHCTVVRGLIDGKRGVCGLYVHGKHGGPDMHGTMPREIAGYITNGPTHCGNCEYYGGGDRESGPCAKIAGAVEFHGCCNYWEKLGKES